jgi:LysM repeat protein
MKRAIVTAILITVCSLAYAVDFSGTRAMGMGNAFTAVNGDIGSLYSNPAGINGVETPELSLNLGGLYNNGSPGTSDGMVYVWPWTHLDSRKAAVHFNSYSLGGESVQETGFNYSNTTQLGRYASRWGTAMKWRTDTATHSSSFMFDGGLQTDFIPKKFTAGVAITNLLSADGALAPTSISWGGLYYSRYGRVTGDLKWYGDRYYLSGGFENDLFQGLMSWRVGLLSSPNSYVTTGLSSWLWPFGFDVAYQWPTSGDEGSGIFQASLRYRFGGKDFSEVYLNRTIDKAANLEYEIQDLESKKSQLAKEIIILNEYKKNPDADINSLPGVSEELNKKPVPTRKEGERPQAPKVKAEVKVITWPQYHRVVPGDTLRSVAEKFYGDPNKWQLIYTANPTKIERGQPRPGEELVIPKP